MQKYIGTKQVKAKPMNRAEYNEYRGWNLPEDEDGEDEGYLIEYLDGGKPNHPDHEGYISWSPSGVFHNAYQPAQGLDFGAAINALRLGLKVSRAGWNGKGMFLILVPGSPSVKPVAGTPYSKAGITEPTNINAHIDMFTATGEMQPGWLASQTDMLSKDWGIVA